MDSTLRGVVKLGRTICDGSLYIVDNVILQWKHAVEAMETIRHEITKAHGLPVNRVPEQFTSVFFFGAEVAGFRPRLVAGSSS